MQIRTSLDKEQYPREPNPECELGTTELAAGVGSSRLSVADGIGVGSGQSCWMHERRTGTVAT